MSEWNPSQSPELPKNGIRRRGWRWATTPASEASAGRRGTAERGQRPIPHGRRDPPQAPLPEGPPIRPLLQNRSEDRSAQSNFIPHARSRSPKTAPRGSCLDAAVPTGNIVGISRCGALQRLLDSRVTRDRSEQRDWLRAELRSAEAEMARGDTPALLSADQRIARLERWLDERADRGAAEWSADASSVQT